MTAPQFKADIEAVNNIPLIQSLLHIVCKTTGMGFAAVARVTEDKWITCSVLDKISFGLKPGDELQVETTICHEIRQNGRPVIIDHVAEDADYCNHHTPAMYGFQSYISMPIILKDGRFFGTLCAIDPSPAKLDTPEVTSMFSLFTDLISFHLSSIEELRTVEDKLFNELENTKSREQFIAILGHDLRNPLGAILNSAQLLLRMPVDDKIRRVANIIQDSGYRMKGLIDNIFDFAHSHLGNGIKLQVQENQPVNDLLGQVVSELRIVHPDRDIRVYFDIAEPVSCDGRRISQLFSNLLGNALAYSPAGTPVIIDAESHNGRFTLSIANSGEKIPEETISRLFEPFYRGEAHSKPEGLGLGLYIASRVAIAHKGRLDVISTDAETKFTLKMPCTQETFYREQAGQPAFEKT